MLYHHYLGAYPGVVAIVAMMAQDFILHIRLFFADATHGIPRL